MNSYKILMWNGKEYFYKEVEATLCICENNSIKFYSGDLESGLLLMVRDEYWISVEKAEITAKGEHPFCMANDFETAIASSQL